MVLVAFAAGVAVGVGSTIAALTLYYRQLAEGGT